MFYDQTVARLRPSVKTTDSGESALDYEGLSQLPGAPWEGVYVKPFSQAEVTEEDRETAVSRWRISSNPRAGDFDIVHTDWVRLPTGEVCRVLGDVARAYSPINGRLHHLEVTVEEVKS